MDNIKLAGIEYPLFLYQQLLSYIRRSAIYGCQLGFNFPSKSVLHRLAACRRYLENLCQKEIYHLYMGCFIKVDVPRPRTCCYNYYFCWFPIYTFTLFCDFPIVTCENILKGRGIHHTDRLEFWISRSRIVAYNS